MSDKKAFTRGASALAGLLLVLQAVFAGLATAAAGQSDALGQTCAPQRVSVADASIPGAPAPASSEHHSGLCCVLHGGALPGPDGSSSFAFAIDFPLQVQPLASYRFDASRSVPEFSPQSPRAPPAFAV